MLGLHSLPTMKVMEETREMDPLYKRILQALGQAVIPKTCLLSHKDTGKS